MNSILHITIVSCLMLGCRSSEFGSNASKRRPSDGSADTQGALSELAQKELSKLKSEPFTTQLMAQDGACTEPNPSGIIDFESIQIPTISTNSFVASHGITFSQNYRVYTTTRRGEAQPPKAEQAWLCVLCTGQPSRNRLVDAAAENIVGRKVLGSIDPKNEVQTLEMTFFSPVSHGSFDLIDDDGSEQWIFMMFNQAGVMIESQNLPKFRGYNINRTGNGKPNRIEFSRPTAEISAVRLIGFKKHGFFGFALDNIAVNVCQVALPTTSPVPSPTPPVPTISPSPTPLPTLDPVHIDPEPKK